MSKPLVIGLCGEARAGKDTAAVYLAHDLNGGGMENERLTVIIASLASPIKQMVRVILDMLPEDHDADRYVSVNAMLNGSAKEEPIAQLNDTSPREMLQTLGTNWGRDMVSPSLWLDVMRWKIKRETHFGDCYAKRSVFIIPDIRFDNEAELCDVLYQVTRADKPEVAEHSSEAGISPHLITGTIDNSGDRLALSRAVSKLAKEIISEHRLPR